MTTPSKRTPFAESRAMFPDAECRRAFRSGPPPVPLAALAAIDARRTRSPEDRFRVAVRERFWAPTSTTAAAAPPEFLQPQVDLGSHPRQSPQSTRR